MTGTSAATTDDEMTWRMCTVPHVATLQPNNIVVQFILLHGIIQHISVE